MADAQIDTLANLLDFFETEVAAMTESSAKNYAKALAVLRAFVDAAPGGSVGEFVLFMIVRGLSAKSAIHYLDLVSSLYGMAVANGHAEQTGEFRRVKAAAKELLTLESVNEQGFGRLVELARSVGASRREGFDFAGAIVFSLLAGAMPLNEVVRLKKGDLGEFSDDARAFAGRYVASGRQFVFDFKQSRLTPRRLELRLQADLERLFGVYGISIVGSPDDTLRGYWAYAALRCGASGTEVLAALGDYPAALPLLRLLPPPAESRPQRNGSLAETVGNLYLANPLNWYAMRMRPRVRFSALEERIASLSAAQRPRLFYPNEEIAKRVGKKLITDRRPLIPGVVFFRARVTDIQPLFRQIGDLAWCYTSAGVYARISSDSMLRFETAIGQFTPDFEVAPVGTFPIGPGTKVVIVGGPMLNRNAVVDDIKQTRSGVIYRLRIFGDERDIEYRLSDSRLIQPCN